MTTIYTSSLSLETWPLYRVVRKVAGEYVDPTETLPSVAFVTSGKPTDEDWLTGLWDTDPTVYPPAYYITCLVGPAGTFEPSVGTYYIWVKFSDGTETPVLRVGELIVE